MTNQHQSCEQMNEQLSGYLDGELTQQESQRVVLHIGSCQACRESYKQLKQMKNLIGQSTYPKIEEDDLDKLLNEFTSKSIANYSWIAIVIGVGLISAFGLFAFLLNPNMPWIMKLAISLVGGGLIGLLISVLRQRLISYKNDKYRRVKL